MRVCYDDLSRVEQRGKPGLFGDPSRPASGRCGEHDRRNLRPTESFPDLSEVPGLLRVRRLLSEHTRDRVGIAKGLPHYRADRLGKSVVALRGEEQPLAER